MHTSPLGPLNVARLTGGPVRPKIRVVVQLWLGRQAAAEIPKTGKELDASLTCHVEGVTGGKQIMTNNRSSGEQ